MPILSQDINMLLNSHHPPREVVRTHMVLLRLNWTPEDQGIISVLSAQCQGSQETFSFGSSGPGGL